MKKTVKKLDNSVVNALTNACEIAKDWNCGFEWLTHTANYNNFPDSLMITCVFKLDADLNQAVETNKDIPLLLLIQDRLKDEGIGLKKIHRHVRLDSEESCQHEDSGNWDKRVKRFQR